MPRNHTGRRPVVLVASVLAGVLSLAACTTASTPSAPSSAPSAAASVPAGLASFYAQRLAWTPCGQGHACATASVPLDYADPAGATLTLALKRVPASATPRLGTLFVNPGGPGVGTDAGDWFDRTGLEPYDLITWDPRGTGASPVVCADAAGTDRYLATDSSPDDAAESDALLAAQRAFTDACAVHTSTAVLAHVSSAENARDLDILRAAAGDDRLTFYGASYGTLIGALYAEFFPGNVGRLVLDSPVDVTGAEAVQQSAGMEAALDGFAAWCAAEGECGLGADAEGVHRTLETWLTSLDAAPLARPGPTGPVAWGRVLTQSLAAQAVTAHLYPGRTGWPALRDAVTAARQGDPTALLSAADAFNGRRADGSYTSQLAAGTAILCADRRHPTAEEALSRWAAAATPAPLLGRLVGPDVSCTSWPVAERPWITPRAAGAPPILVVGATGDPATPYAWARVTASTLVGARLLTYDGPRHVTYGRSDCADAAVRAYLLTGVLPAAGAVCEAD